MGTHEQVALRDLLQQIKREIEESYQYVHTHTNTHTTSEGRNSGIQEEGKGDLATVLVLASVKRKQAGKKRQERHTRFSVFPLMS